MKLFLFFNKYRMKELQASTSSIHISRVTKANAGERQNSKRGISKS